MQVLAPFCKRLNKLIVNSKEAKDSKDLQELQKANIELATIGSEIFNKSASKKDYSKIYDILDDMDLDSLSSIASEDDINALKDLCSDSRMYAGMAYGKKFDVENSDRKIKKKWTIQPVDTLQKKDITDAVELLYQLRKEGFKNVLLTSCNPGNVDIPEDIKKDPNFKVTYGTTSVYKESAPVATDEVEEQLNLMEAYLDESAARNGIVLNEAATLEDLYNEYTAIYNSGKISYLHEGVGDFLKTLASKAVEIVIALWKALLKFFRAIWQKIKEFFVGKPTEKAQEKKTEKPIEATIIEISGNHASTKKIKGNTLEEVKNEVLKSTQKISQAMNNISKEETSAMEYIKSKTPSVKSNKEAKKEKENSNNENFLIHYGARKYLHELTEKEDSDFKKILNDYKVSNDADKPNKLMTLVRKLYSLSPENIIDGTPSLLKYVRGILVIGGFAINPVIGVIAFIADQVTKAHMNKEEAYQMREAFKNEIRSTQKKIDTTKSATTRENLEKYNESLLTAYKKIDEYYESTLTDKELDAKYDAADDDDISTMGGGEFGDAELDAFEKMFGDDFDMDDDFGDLDDMDGFEESGKFVVLMGHLIDAYNEGGCEEKSFDQHKCKKMIRMNPSIVGDLAKVSDKYPTIISKHDLANAIDDVRSDIQIGAVRINMIERYELNNTYDEIMRSRDTIIETTDIFQEAKRFAAGIEISKALNEIYSTCTYYSPLTEASFTNSLKLAGEKLKKGIQKAADADKTISKNIDSSMSAFTRAAERAMTNDRRDAIIKGSVIPSASKVIKGAIMAGAAWLVLGPAVAVIGVLGYLGVSKKLNDKQRKALIDEIEIELKMCQKYIDLAESKNDLKALKKLYTIQRELEKQRAKIKYKIGLKGERYHSPESMPTDGID